MLVAPCCASRNNVPPKCLELVRNGLPSVLGLKSRIPGASIQTLETVLYSTMQPPLPRAEQQRTERPIDQRSKDELCHPTSMFMVSLVSSWFCLFVSLNQHVHGLIGFALVLSTCFTSACIEYVGPLPQLKCSLSLISFQEHALSNTFLFPSAFWPSCQTEYCHLFLES